ncbi:MAG TPA: DUF2231 domain-containing protein [Micromonosporaceae bacterium]|nr:DUF2231 domain-containing protein [Micromonosporaceae bacterium]
MLEQIMGLPTHVLLVHAAVVLVPLLAAGAAVYAVLPRLRPRLRWVVLVLAVVAPLAALFTKLSGDAFFAALQNLDRLPKPLPTVQQHQQYGSITAWVTGGLAVVTLLMIYVTERPPSWMSSSPSARRGITLLFTVLVLGLAAVSAVYIFLTGDSGARMNWEDILKTS